LKAIYRFSQAPAIIVGACGHGLAVVRALREGQVPVLLLEANLRQAGARTQLAPIVPVADINGPGLIEALLALRQRMQTPEPPLIFLTNDRMVSTLATGWSRLEGQYRLSWAHCRDAIAKLLDKHHLEAHCKRQGSDYPPTFVLRGASEIDAAMAVTGTPFIVKPAQPLAGFKTALPKDRNEFAQLIKSFGANLPFLAQRFIAGDDRRIYFCALYLHRGEVLARFDGHKLRSRPMGHTTIAESSVQDDVYQQTLRFFSGLGLSGPVSLELKRDEEGRLWVIEPTVGRTDFWIGLCTANGVNLPLAEYYSQTSGDSQRQVQKDLAVWFNEERDPFGRLWLWRQPGLSLRRRRPIYLYLHGDDLRPALSILSSTCARLIRAVPRRLVKLLSGNLRQDP
jgi:D-aspartate ligase